MKKTPLRYVIVTFVLFVLFLQSCGKKNDPDPAVTPGSTQSPTGETYYIHFKLDGVQKEFSKDAGVAQVKSSDTNYSLQAAGNLTKNVLKVNSVGFLVLDDRPISTGITYTDYSTTLAASRYLPNMFVHYTDENGNFYSSYAEQIAGLFQITPDAKVIITEITPTQVKATFSSTVYYSPTGSGKLTSRHVISEGQIVLQKL